MSWNLPFLKPATHIARLPEAQIKRLYPKMRWQIMESTFIGYAIFYFVRNNLPIVTKDMGEQLHYSKGQIGDILAITAITYGIGKFFMGAWSDRSNPRYFMPMGLLLTAFCNFAFGAVHSYPIHLALWGLNGLFQSMGWAPCGRSLGHWYSIRERGTKFAFWNVAQNVGGGLTGLVVAYSAEQFGWRSAFYVPGILAVLCAIYLIVRLRDTPQSVGLPPIEEYRNDYPVIKASDSEQELGTYDLMVNYILTNPYIWLFAFANFFVYVARYGMLDWGPYYLREVKNASLVQGGISTAALEFSAIFGTILMGWLSDKLGGRRGMIGVFCMIPVILAYLGIIYCPDNMLWVDMVLFGVIGFFIYPAILLLVVSALDYTSKKAVGTAAGFIGLFGYVGRVTVDKGVSMLVYRYHNWNAALYSILASAVVAMVLLAWMWRLSPHRVEDIESPGLSKRSAGIKPGVK
jgi:OPA family glycerol-3-phosphate transporter-like MFS transporter